MKIITSTNADAISIEMSAAEMQLIRAFRTMDGEYGRLWLNTGMSLSAKYFKEERLRFEIIRRGQS